jgi:5-methyltetrahydrofolate--homocysteine methyltransferase
MKERMNPVEFARLRRQMADEFERLMWQLLRNRQRCNEKFRREHLLGIYTADFYCVRARLVVEVDGESHQSDEAKQYDEVRDQWMKEQGIRVLRFTCTQVERETQNVLAQIDKALLESPSPPAPLPMNSDND